MRQIELLMLASALTALAATVGLEAYTARKLPSVELIRIVSAERTQRLSRPSWDAVRARRVRDGGAACA